MAVPNGTNGDPQDKSIEAIRRAWAEFEVGIIEKYGHLPFDQFRAIVSHEMRLKCEEDAQLKEGLEDVRSRFIIGTSSSRRVIVVPYNSDMSLYEHAEQRAEHLWNQCQPKLSVAEEEFKDQIEKLRNSVDELSDELMALFKDEINKVRDEVNRLSTNKSTDESTNSIWFQFLGCLGFIFLIVIIIMVIRWIVR